MKLRIYVFLGVLCLVALGVAWFLSNFEQVRVKESVGASGEARSRQFLAAERLAGRLGWKARELRALPELDALPAQGVLLLPNRRQAIAGERLAQLVGWVERGGHLIAEAEFLGVPDPLLERLQVQREQAAAPAKPLLAELPPRRLSVALPAAMKLARAGDARLRVGEQLISFTQGRGIVTVATTLHFASNRAIGAGDHAELLAHLLASTPGRELAVYFRPERLSLWGFLKEHAAPALAAAGLLLALWLWRIAPRFGPVAPDAPPGRRRLLDHLRASGRYFWVKGLRPRLVLAARDAALRRLAAAQPDFATAPQRERAARLALLMNAPVEEANRFLVAGGAMRGAEFIKLVQYAQRVHSALEKGAKQ